MDVQETLAQIDRAITEIDLVLHQWQTDLDMMSFICVDASFELWTNDDPPIVIPRDVMTEALVAAAGKELRVMHYTDGKPSQVGTAVIAPDGTIAAKITEDIPELRTHTHFSVSSLSYTKPRRPAVIDRALAHYTMHLDGSVTDNYTGRKIVEEYDPDENVPNKIKWAEHVKDFQDHIENHRFFKKEN